MGRRCDNRHGRRWVGVVQAAVGGCMGWHVCTFACHFSWAMLLLLLQEVGLVVAAVEEEACGKGCSSCEQCWKMPLRLVHHDAWPEVAASCTSFTEQWQAYYHLGCLL